MPVARIIAADFEQARHFISPLESLGYTVEVFDPQQLRLSPADLEIEVESVSLAEAVQRAEDLANQQEADVFVAPGLFRSVAEEPQPEPRAALSEVARAKYATLARGMGAAAAAGSVKAKSTWVTTRTLMASAASSMRVSLVAVLMQTKLLFRKCDSAISAQVRQWRESAYQAQLARRAYRLREAEIRELAQQRLTEDRAKQRRAPELPAESTAVAGELRSTTTGSSPQWSASTIPVQVAREPLSRRERQWRAAAVGASVLSLGLTIAFAVAISHRSAPPLPATNPSLTQQVPFGPAKIAPAIVTPAASAPKPSAGHTAKKQITLAASRRNRTNDDGDEVTIRHFAPEPAPAPPTSVQQQNGVRKISDIQH